MISIFYKEINAFFSSLIGYIVIGIFLLFMGLMLWVFPDYSLLEYHYASLDPLFELAPFVFMFLIPAITMRSFAEEKQSGTIELLATRPITDRQIILGKFFACWILVLFALLPTVLYYYTIYELGAPKGNLDTGAIMGSYVGLVLLSGVFAATGLLASAMTNNQIVAFLVAVFFCFVFYWGFDLISRLPVFLGKTDDAIQMFGIDYHYASISRGIIDWRDILYFISSIVILLMGCQVVLESRKW